jgi:hypothetical protein
VRSRHPSRLPARLRETGFLFQMTLSGRGPSHQSHLKSSFRFYESPTLDRPDDTDRRSPDRGPYSVGTATSGSYAHPLSTGRRGGPRFLCDSSTLNGAHGRLVRRVLDSPRDLAVNRREARNDGALPGSSSRRTRNARRWRIPRHCAAADLLMATQQPGDQVEATQARDEIESGPHPAWENVPAC